MISIAEGEKHVSLTINMYMLSEDWDVTALGRGGLMQRYQMRKTLPAEAKTCTNQ